MGARAPLCEHSLRATPQIAASRPPAASAALAAASRARGAQPTRPGGAGDAAKCRLCVQTAVIMQVWPGTLATTCTMSETIVRATVSSPTNIAVIKYWGKRDAKQNVPINSSVSLTLNQRDLRTVTTVTASTTFDRDRLWLNGVEEDLTANKRMLTVLRETRARAGDLYDADGKCIVAQADWAQMCVRVVSANNFPTAAGLASSAAGYAALTYALAQLMAVKEAFPGELSTIARMGSGSACRSLHGGFVAWDMGVKEDCTDSCARQVAPHAHWPELQVRAAPSLARLPARPAPRTTRLHNQPHIRSGSHPRGVRPQEDGLLDRGDGHVRRNLATPRAPRDRRRPRTVRTHGSHSLQITRRLPDARHRHALLWRGCGDRMTEMEKAYLGKDFAAVARLAMQDSNQFHATCLDTYPPIFYLNDVSRAIIGLVHAFNVSDAEPRSPEISCAAASPILACRRPHTHTYGHAGCVRRGPPRLYLRRGPECGSHCAEGARGAGADHAAHGPSPPPRS